MVCIFPTRSVPIKNRNKRQHKRVKETRPSTGLFDCCRVEIIQVISAWRRLPVSESLDPTDSPVSTRSVLTRVAFKRQFVRLINRVHTSGPCVTGVLRVYAHTRTHALSFNYQLLAAVSCSWRRAAPAQLVNHLCLPRPPRRRFVHVHPVFLRRLLHLQEKLRNTKLYHRFKVYFFILLGNTNFPLLLRDSTGHQKTNFTKIRWSFWFVWPSMIILYWPIKTESSFNSDENCLTLFGINLRLHERGANTLPPCPSRQNQCRVGERDRRVMNAGWVGGQQQIFRSWGWNHTVLSTWNFFH